MTRPLLVTVLVFLGAPLGAQGYASRERGYGEFAVVRAASSGDSLATRLKPGYGFAVMAVIPAQSPLMVAAGFQFTSHATVDSTPAASRLGALQAFIEPRFVLRQSGPLIPYVSVRAGLVRWSQDLSLVDDYGYDAVENTVQSGSVLGVGAGVLVRAVPHIFGFFSAAYQRVSVGRLSAGGTPVAGPGGAGVVATSLVLSVGASLEFSAIPSRLRTFPAR